MNVETLQNMSKIAFVIAIVAFLCAVLMFFLFNIPKLFSELTGRAAKKFIVEAKKKNEVDETIINPGTSEILLSSELISTKLNSQSMSEATTKLTSKLIYPQETTSLTVNPLTQYSAQQNNNQKIPNVNLGTKFLIVEELSFTSSTEIIE